MLDPEMPAKRPAVVELTPGTSDRRARGRPRDQP
jgi:hypothetical protein